MRRMAPLALCLVCGAAPLWADATYDAAVGKMVALVPAPDMDGSTNARIASCYVDVMTAGQIAATAAAEDSGELYDVLIDLPMSAVDCENAIISEVTGEEVTRP